MFFGRMDLYSDHWVTSRILVLAGLPGTIFLTKSTMVNYLQRLSSIESSPGCDLLRVLYKSILPKNMAALKSDVTSAVLN